MAGMLGARLRASRRFTCRYGCCTYDEAHLRRTKQERSREKAAWRREWRNG